MLSILARTAPPAPPPTGFALWSLGFRPFYLLAAAFALVSVGLWALQFAGLLPFAYLDGPLHLAHEMVFGFALAVIVGFLFTAVRNWTDRPTPSGTPLAVLAALWLAARVLAATPWSIAAAAASVAFPLAAAAALAVPLAGAKNRRNYFFVALLALLGAADLGFWLAQAGVLDAPARRFVQFGLDVVLFVVAVMAGRVIPMFTNNGAPGARATRQPVVEKIAIGATLALLPLDGIGVDARALAAVAALAGMAHLVRWLLWKPWRTRRVPILWVLHLAYAWVPLHLALRATGALPSLATHALTVGAIGGLVVGMMTRTARGHTGRPLRASRLEVWAYALVALAAALRVLLPWVAPSLALPAVEASALAWCLGFAAYLVVFTPFLLAPRADGRPA